MNHLPVSRQASRITKRLVALSIALAVLGNLLPHTASADEPAKAKRPNIVFVFSDDHALQAIGAYGSKINKTPNLDRIANEGAVFHNSFCANSICGPSRACILTGKHSHINGFLRNGNRFDASQVTFPKLLQDVGYQTALIGKWHLGTDPVGFNHWEILPGQGNYYNPDFIQMDGSRKRYTGYVTDIITENTLNWLQNDRDEDQPFVLMCQHKAPHRNWSPPPRHFDLYKGVDVPEPETLFDDYAARSKLLHESEMSLENHFYWGHDMKFHGESLFPEQFLPRLGNGEYRRMNDEQKAAWDAAYEPENQKFIADMKAGKLSSKDITKWKYQRYIKDYLGTVQAVDDSVGELLAYLDESGLAENTIVIYSSDQGFYLGEHGWYDKRWMFEESLRMPFLIRWPGVIAPGTESTAPIQNIDYAPTFLEAAGAEIPEAIQGRSMVSMMKDGCRASSTWRDAVYYAYYENAAVHMVPVHDGVRTERYKLMFFPRSREWNLFDLETDPLELKSVHDDPEYADILAGLKKRYVDLRDLYDVNSATIPATRGDEPGWQKRNMAMSKLAKTAKPKLAFIGDSITQGWEGRGKKVWEENYAKHDTINLGIGGDRTEHIIWRLTHGNLGKIQPEVAVLMIGTNNTGHFMQDPTQIAEGVEKILSILREKLPKTKIVLQAIMPRGKTKMDLMRLNNIAVNDRIAKMADGENIVYVDLGDHFMNEDGTIDPAIMPDYLHLSEKGYEIWADALAPTLESLGL
ncbi:sulfatase/phosphatase domain-containing protein [Rhodopirellula europaea]|uniref:Mucin-desulfating sulfatase (N-acetylglucosamine-6-sulfatase) n=1 Tax=Rhodopirellula europaea 6C TaxID=1263867 RepID=M2AYS0_9BACT|nr:sulfatase/phosphatase domain-containing protein [Rhodopirellula europaea]EMB15114.1 mucin-desulfating sulfatase (N-acetylglucosamine-6-sulfatase) [Rhodopirellula europaea 6C]